TITPRSKITFAFGMTRVPSKRRTSRMAVAACAVAAKMAAKINAAASFLLTIHFPFIATVTDRGENENHDPCNPTRHHAPQRPPPPRSDHAQGELRVVIRGEDEGDLLDGARQDLDGDPLPGQESHRQVD